MQPHVEPEATTPPSLRRITLATDLGAESTELFAHGLAFALRARAELFLVHVSDGDHPEATWRRLPTVRAMLERWGKLPAEASHAEFEALGIKVHAVDREPTEKDVVAAVARRMVETHPDLVLLGTHGRTGLSRFLETSVAEPVARDVHRLTMFVPSHARGLVDPETGALRLKRVLVPMAPNTPQQAVIDTLGRLLGALEVGAVAFTLVHVGKHDSVPSPSLPSRGDWAWRTDVRSGQVVEQILQAEVEHEADLIAMATRGHDSVLDELLGSRTERVVRRARCPVLAVPV